VQLTPDKPLQRTFDLLPIFAVAKKGVALNAAELRRRSWPEEYMS
jgi:hypothetical protein